MRSFSLPLVGLLLFAPSVAASTYVVDDDGGPGVDFVDIASALTAAAPGDVIVVREGTYGGFTLNVGLSIVGEPGAVVTGGIQVGGLPAQPRTTLTGLTTRWININQCAGPITLEELNTTPGAPLGALTAMITVRDSADVRLRGVEVPMIWVGDFEALLVHSSRVEVTHSVLHGSFGHSHNIYTYPGPPQMAATASPSRVAASYTSRRAWYAAGWVEICRA